MFTKTLKYIFLLITMTHKITAYDPLNNYNQAIKTLSDSIKGELTIVLSEKINEKNIKKTISESVKIDIKKMIKKYSHKDGVEFISRKENLKKKIVYKYCLKLKK